MSVKRRVLNHRTSTNGFIAVLLAATTHSGVVAQNTAGWDEVLIDNSFAPLELRLGPMPNGELGVMALWNLTPGVNRIGAFRLPYPHDGAGVIFDSEIDTGALFGLGKPCLSNGQVVVPYVDNAAANVLDLRVARFDGANWSHTLLAGGTEDFDSADCAVTREGLYVSAHSVTNNRINLYRSTNDGASFFLEDTLTASGGILGPSQGASRDSINGLADGSLLVFAYQRADGVLFTRTYSTDPTRGPGSGATCPGASLEPPSGIFDVVREIRAILGRNIVDEIRAHATYLGSEPGTGNLTRGYITVDTVDSCSAVFPGNLGPPDPLGAAGFQSPGVFFDPVGDYSNVLWGDYFYINEAPVGMGSPPLIDSTDELYPLDTAGPRDACYTFYGRYGRGHAAGRREPLGTTFATRYSQTSFSDGFESVPPVTACNNSAFETSP